MPSLLRPLAAALALSLAGHAAAEQDPMTKMIVGYDLTMPRAKMVARFYEALAKWAKEHPKELAALAPKLRGTGLEEAAIAFEAEPGIQKLLAAHELTGRDALLLPIALDATLSQVFAESKGMKMPHDAVNRRNIEAVLKEKRSAEDVSRRIRAARQALGPPPAP